MFAFLRTLPLATLITLRDEATAAYTRLITGKAVRVVVDQNGERVEFTAVKASDLAAYIQAIQAAIDALNGAETTYTRPIGFYF